MFRFALKTVGQQSLRIPLPVYSKNIKFSTYPNLFNNEESNDQDVFKKAKAKAKRKKKKETLDFKVLHAKGFKFSMRKGTKINKVPKIGFGLDRTLFNPGVTYLKDPNSKIYNFDPYLEKIIPIEKFDLSKIITFIPAVKDTVLHDITRKAKKKYCSSTSSISHLLCHLTFILTNWRPFDTSVLSSNFSEMSGKFGRTLTIPASVRIIKHKGSIYSINADKSFDSASSILSELGQIMERMLTTTPENFDKYTYKENASEEDSQPLETELNSVYSYGMTNNLVLRAQLDCTDPRLPKQIFDLKTRAVYPVRLDKMNYKDYAGYELKSLHGKVESFEKEYYDLMRSAFLKYSYQVRIGNMDGCLVAYHNCQKIFGFQYVSLKEMDQRLYGSSILGDQVFANASQLLETILDKIVDVHPDLDVLVTFKSNQDSPILNIYAEYFDRASDPPKATPADDLDYSELPDDLNEAPAVESKSYIRVDPTNPLVKFQLMVYSTIDGKKVITPLHLDNPKSKWSVHYHLERKQVDQLELYNEYVSLRHTQQNYFKAGKINIPQLKQFARLNVEEEDLDKPKVVYKPIFDNVLSKKQNKPTKSRVSVKSNSMDAETH